MSAEAITLLETALTNMKATLDTGIELDSIYVQVGYKDRYESAAWGNQVHLLTTLFNSLLDPECMINRKAVKILALQMLNSLEDITIAEITIDPNSN